MSQLSQFHIDNNESKIYYDINITNVLNQTTQPPIIQFKEQRQNAFVKNSGDYYFSIVRFSLDTNTLPLFIPEIVPNQANINLTVYSITLEYGAFTVQQPITWVPQNAFAELPASPSSTFNKLQDNSTGYYYCFNYTYFTFLIQSAFDLAFASLQALVGAPIATANAPVIIWNTDNNSAGVYAESAYYDNYPVGIVPTPIKIFFNSPLANLLPSFVAKNFGAQGVTLGRNFLLTIGNFNGTQTIYLPTSAPVASQYVATTVFQEYSTISSWTPISSIVFTSATLPIVPNQLSAPLIFAEGGIVYANDGNNANFAQIITDFIADGGQYKPNIIYTPTQLRLIDLYGNSPISLIDINVFWKSKLGEFYPMQLNSGGACSIKCLFTKKGTISH
jgi:hypothetical protein